MRLRTALPAILPCLFVTLAAHAQFALQPTPVTFHPTYQLLPASVATAPTLSPLPDAPGFPSSDETPGDDPQQTSTTKQGQPANNNPAPADQGPAKRLFFIIPNFRSVRSTVKLPPQTIRQKFTDATKDTFDYSAFALEFILAGYSQLTNATPQFGTGGVAYGRYLWHTTADQSIENYMVEFIIPVATHEDTRFYQLGKGGFLKRTGYALSRTFVTRSDSGRETFNAGEVVGAAASSGISELYYPHQQRTAGQFISKYATSLGIDAAAYFLREFEPEISRVMTHHNPTPPPAH
jgi:hypothetical protein